MVSWMQARCVIRTAPRYEDLKWMESLARMLQVSLIAFAVGGAFLSMSYWDMPYYTVVVIVAMRRLLLDRTKAARNASPELNPALPVC